MAVIVCDGDHDDIRDIVSKSMREDNKTKKSRYNDDEAHVEAEVASTSSSSSSSKSSKKETRPPRSNRKMKKLDSNEFQDDFDIYEDGDNDDASSSKKKRVRGGRRRVKNDDVDLAKADNELDIKHRSTRKGRSSKSSLQVALSMRREQEKKQQQQQQEEEDQKTKSLRSKTPKNRRGSRSTSSDENNSVTRRQKSSVSKSTRGSRRTKSAIESIPHSHIIGAVSETKSPKPRSNRSVRATKSGGTENLAKSAAALDVGIRTSETPRRSKSAIASLTHSHTIGAASETNSPKPKSNRSVRATTKSSGIEKLAKSVVAIDMDIRIGESGLDATKMMKPKSPSSLPRPTTSVGVEKLAKSAVVLSPSRPSKTSPSSIGKPRSKSITAGNVSSRRSKSTTPIRSRRRSSFDSPVLAAKSFLSPRATRRETKQNFLFNGLNSVLTSEGLDDDGNKVLTLEESFEALWKGEDKSRNSDVLDEDHDYNDINIDDDIEDDVQNNIFSTDKNDDHDNSSLQIAELRKKRDQQMKKLQENELSMAELRQKTILLQMQLEARDDECKKVTNQLNELKQENKLLTIELDGTIEKQPDHEQNKKDSNLNSNENIRAAANLLEAEDRIKVLEKELEDTNKVSKLQLEELDDEMKILSEKIKLQQKETDQKLKMKDTIINELQTKVRHLEGSINQTDVDTIESAKQKVYEARKDATSVREKLIACQSTCQQLQETNNELMNQNLQLEQTNANREELEKKIVERTQDAHEWKIRTEAAERKLLTITTSGGDRRTSPNNSSNASNQQDMSLQAALAKSNNNNTNNNNNGRRWGIFGGNNNNNATTNVGGSNNLPVTDESRNDNDSNTTIKQIQSLNDTIAALQSEIVQLSSKQKEEAYIQKKKIMQLEGENEALVLQNATLEKLSRFHDDN